MGRKAVCMMIGALCVTAAVSGCGLLPSGKSKEAKADESTVLESVVVESAAESVTPTPEVQAAPLEQLEGVYTEELSRKGCISSAR